MVRHPVGLPSPSPYDDDMLGEALPPEFRLSFCIGEVVRNDVYVETEARVLWGQLRRAEVVSDPMQRNFGRLLPDLLRGLRDERVPTAFRDLALPVITLAREAHDDRNKLAHDQWVSVPWVPDEVAGVRSDSRRELEEFTRCAQTLLDLTWRVRGLAIIAPVWLGTDTSAIDDREEMWHWTRVAMGSHDASTSAMRGTPGPAVLPPGW